VRNGFAHERGEGVRTDVLDCTGDHVAAILPRESRGVVGA
jgi:hypothetical protein